MRSSSCWNDEFACLVRFATVGARTWIGFSSIGASFSCGTALIAGDEHALFSWLLCCFGGGWNGLDTSWAVDESSEETGFCESFCTASDAFFLASIARFNPFTAIENIRAVPSFLFTSQAYFLEFWRDDQDTVDSSILTCFARILMCIFNQTAVIIALLKAASAATALRMSSGKAIDC